MDTATIFIVFSKHRSRNDYKMNNGQMKDKVCVIMINYNTPKVTEEGIQSALRIINNYSTIFVVDNASQDDSYENLKKRFATNNQVVVVRSEYNGGFSAGNNIGIKYAIQNKFDYVMLLNNDTEVDADLLMELMANSDDHTVTTPKMYYFSEKNKIWFAGGKINKFNGRITHIGENEIDKGQYDDAKKIDFATGCCMLIPISVINKIGLMDESYFMYVEDVDYSLRMKKNNINIVYVPTAKLWHKVGASSGSKSKLTVYYGNRGKFMLMRKYKFLFSAKSFFYVTRFILLIRGILKNSNDKYIFKAWTDYKRGIVGKVKL